MYLGTDLLEACSLLDFSFRTDILWRLAELAFSERSSSSNSDEMSLKLDLLRAMQWVQSWQ